MEKTNTSCCTRTAMSSLCTGETALGHHCHPINNKRALEEARSIIEQAESESLSGNVPEQESHREEIRDIDYMKYEYDFENIVFEGGGAKGIVYVGALEVLEEVGVKPQRYAGASAGAMVATLAAVGYNSSEIRQVLELDLKEILLDHTWGCLSLLPNMLKSFGWNPGKKLRRKFGELIKNKLGDSNITFKQLYDKTKKELCIMAVNVNMMRAEYFHVKTTPNVPIKKAVRMSMSIPGVFKPVHLPTITGSTDLYVDGGVLCNYPLHAYDGWWLSMKLEDSFLNRIQPLSNINKLTDNDVRFRERNDKSIGFLVYSAHEQEVMRAKLEKRVGLRLTQDMRPNTKLYKKRQADVLDKGSHIKDHPIVFGAFERFVKALQEVAGNHQGMITRSEVTKVITEAKPVERYDPSATKFNTFDMRILFGEEFDPDHIFTELDSDNIGKISYEELVHYASRAGVNINARYEGYNRQPIHKLGQFISVLTNSLLTNSTKMYTKAEDFHRTIGINCDYIETMDFTLEEADRVFAIEQGRRSTISFLKHYIYNNRDKVNERAKSAANSR